MDNYNDKNKKEIIHWIKLFFVFSIRLILMLIAGYLSLHCSQNTNIFLRIIFLITSVVFSEFYILYYSIYRIFLGNTCPI